MTSSRVAVDGAAPLAPQARGPRRVRLRGGVVGTSGAVHGQDPPGGCTTASNYRAFHDTVARWASAQGWCRSRRLPPTRYGHMKNALAYRHQVELLVVKLCIRPHGDLAPE